MVDPLIQRLLERAIDTPVKLHLLLMFHDNQHLVATPKLVAERACRDIWSVSEALHQLAEDGVIRLLAEQQGEPRYCYGPQDEHQEAIVRLIRGYDDPLERDTLQRSIRELALFASYRRSSVLVAPMA